jgi:NADH dehydrogenase
VSALGVQADSKARYMRTKWQGERLVRYSGMRWTILRPGVILGAEGEFFRMMSSFARLSLNPLPGEGAFLFQPVAVEQVAKALVDAALETGGRFEGKTYEACGSETATYRQIIEGIAKAMGRRPPAFLKVPIPLLKAGAFFLDWAPFFPVTRDELAMMGEGNVAQDAKAFIDDFGMTPIPLEKLILHCVGRAPLSGGSEGGDGT